MSCWILAQSGIPMSVTTVQRVTNSEKQTNEMKNCMEDFQHSVQSKWNARTSTIELPQSDQQNVPSLENEDEEFTNKFERVIESEDLADSVDNEMEKLGPDDWLNMEVEIDMEEHGLCHGEVEKRAVDTNGNPTGVANDNVSLDSRACKIEFTDGQAETMTTSVIVENLPAEMDVEGNRFLLVEEIEDHRKTAHAMPREQGTCETSCRIKRKRRTTRGWEFLVKWKGRNSDWVTLKELKESHPVQPADHAISNNLQQEPAFAWWPPHVQRKGEAIMSKVKSKHFERTCKHGLQMSKTWKEASETDKEDGDHLWEDAVEQEMKNS